jgi:hypothetical protein
MDAAQQLTTASPSARRAFAYRSRSTASIDRRVKQTADG